MLLSRIGKMLTLVGILALLIPLVIACAAPAEEATPTTAPVPTVALTKAPEATVAPTVAPASKATPAAKATPNYGGVLTVH